MLICPKCGSNNCYLLAIGEFNQNEVGCQNPDCYYQGTMVEFTPKEYLVISQGESIARIIDFDRGFIDLIRDITDITEIDIKEVITS